MNSQARLSHPQTKNQWRLTWFSLAFLTLILVQPQPVAAVTPPQMVNLPVADLVYDPDQDRLLLSLGTNTAGIGPTNGIALFNPHTASIESFTPLGKHPGRMSRTSGAVGGEQLYVSIPSDGLVRRLALPSLAQLQEFALGGEVINSIYYPYFAGELAPMPGRPDDLVIWRIRPFRPQVSQAGVGLALFQNGVLRSNTLPVGSTWTTEFAGSSENFFALQSGQDVLGALCNLHRCLIGSNGLSITQTTKIGGTAGPEIKFSAGHLFSTKGRVVRTNAMETVEWIFMGAEDARLVELDEPSDSIFFLTPGNPNRLKRYDLATRTLLSEQAIPGVTGFPLKMVRWGTNGLAFHTSSNQLFLLRFPAEPEPALALSYSGSPSPLPVGATATRSLLVTNQGPGGATNIFVTNSFSHEVLIESVLPSAGTVTTNGSNLIWSLPALEDAATASLVLKFSRTQAGVVTLRAMVGREAGQSLRPTDTALDTVNFGTSNQDEWRMLKLGVNDLVWSRTLQTFLATASTNNGPWNGGLVSIDPDSLGIAYRAGLGVNGGKLELSGDEQVLHAGVDFGLAAISLPDLVVTNRYTIDPVFVPLRALDLAVVPGSNSLVVVGTDGTGRLMAYDHGAARTNGDTSFFSEFSVEFGDAPNIFYLQNFANGDFRRYALNPAGVTMTDVTQNTVLPRMTPIDLEWGDGLLYSSIGRVVNPFTRALVGTIAGVGTNSAVYFDRENKRVFYLTATGTTGVLRSVDPATLMTIATQPVSGLSGSPRSLHRWGTNGLAFRTTGEQIFFIRSRLVPADPPADQALLASSSPAPAMVGSNFFYSITVTNLGPNPATNSQLLVKLSPNAGSIGAVASQGTRTIVNREIVAHFGILLPGETATLSITSAPTAAGLLTLTAKVVANSSDPVLANNELTLSHAVAQVVGPNDIIIMPQSTADLAYNPMRGELYASGPDNRISIINPTLALVTGTWELSGQPGRLALTTDHQKLYATVARTNLIRLSTASGLGDLDLSFNGQQVYDLEPLPGSATSFLMTEGGGATAVYDNQVRRQHTLGGGYLEFGTGSDVAYSLSGTRYKVFNITSTGLTERLWTDLPGPQTDLEFDGGKLFSTPGHIIEPATGSVMDRFAGITVALNAFPLVEPELSRQRVYFLTRISSTWHLRAYDSHSLAYVDGTAIPNLLGTPSSLLRWGDDGLAFCTTSNQLFLIRTFLVPRGAPADLSVTQTPRTSPAIVGSPLTYSITISNTGPAAASNVVLFDRLNTNVTLVGLSGAPGPFTVSNSLISCPIGTLESRASVQLELTVRPSRGGILDNVVSITSGNLDPVLANNVSTNLVPVRLDFGTNGLGVVDLKTSDLDYDPVSGLLYATLTNYFSAPFENAMVSIDPATGLLGEPIPVGPRLSQLRVTDDGSRIYTVAGNGTEVRRLNLATRQVELQFPALAARVEVVPGRPHSVAVAAPRFGGGLSVYDDAIQRTNIISTIDQAGFISSNLLAVFTIHSVPNVLARARLDEGGLTTLPGNVRDVMNGDMVVHGGLIYSTGGRVIEPENLAVVREFGVSGLVAPDQAAGRVSFLTGSGSTRVLRIFDTLASRVWGTVTITNVVGTPERLIRCGADRLAFRTTGGQLFIIRSTAIPTGPPADLAVDLANSTPTGRAGEPFFLTVTVTNLGPNSADGVTVSNRLPSSLSFSNFVASQGSVTSAANGLIWQVGTLASGAVATNRIQLIPGTGGAFDAQAFVFGNNPDTNQINNESRIAWLLHHSADAVPLSVLPLSAGGLVWEPVSQRLLLTVTQPSPVATNSLLIFNPVSGLFDRSIPLGLSLGKVASSADGQTAYVGLSGTGLLKVHLPTGTLITNYANIWTPLEIELPPSLPEVVVLLQVFNTMDAFRNGVELPLQNWNFSWNTPTSLTRIDAGGNLYGYFGGFPSLFFRMTVDNTRLNVRDANTGYAFGAEATIELDNGLVFASSGTVLQPETLTVVTNIPDLAAASLVHPDSGSGLLTFLTPKNGQWWLRTYNQVNYSLLQEFRVPGVLGRPTSLVRWSADGVAFVTTSNQFFLLRPSLAYADLAASHQSWPTQALAGRPFQVSFSMTNLGPAVAADVFVTNQLIPAVAFTSATTSQGNFVVTNNQVIFAIGNLPPQVPVQMTVTMTPNNPGDAVFINNLEVQGAFTDLSLANNRSSVSIVLKADTDRDGLPNDWELANGLSPTNALDAFADSDCDGLSNTEEYLAGSNPSELREIRLLFSSPSLLQVSAPGNWTYAVQASSNLVNWSDITNYRIPHCTLELTNITTLQEMRFYRVIRR